MPIDIEDQLSQYCDWLEQQLGAPMRPPTTPTDHAAVAAGVIEISAQPGHRRWKRSLVAGAAALILVVGTVAALRLRHSDHAPTVLGGSPSSIAPPASNAPSDHLASLLDPGAVELLTAAPLHARGSSAAVWTGSEMIVWGGSAADGQPFGDGARYDPVARTWTMLPEAPIAARRDTATVWTGTEMLIWGGGDNGTSFTDGAAFNPTTNTWRTLPAFDLGSTIRPTTAWTGSEMIVIEGINGTANGAAFNPTTNTWRTIATPPGRFMVPYPDAVWTGTEMVATLAQPPDDAPIIAAYHPATDTWRTLTDDIPSGSDDRAVPSLVWTGSVLLVLNVTDNTIREWDPATGQWSTFDELEPDTARQIHHPVWTGHTVVFSNGSPAVDQFNPTTGLWSTVTVEQPIEKRLDPVSLWADGILLTWGGLITTPDRTYVAASDGTAWRPPTPVDDEPAAASMPPDAQIPVNTYRFVPITELDEPGEATTLADYEAAIADGPITGPDGTTYGNQTDDPTTSPDYIAISDAWHPDTPIVGFTATQGQWAPPGTADTGGGPQPFGIFGFGGSLMGEMTPWTIGDGPGFTTVFVPALAPDGSPLVIPPFNVPMATFPPAGTPASEVTPEDGYIRVWTNDNTEVLGYVLLSDHLASVDNPLPDGSFPPIRLYDGYGNPIGEWTAPIG